MIDNEYYGKVVELKWLILPKTDISNLTEDILNIDRETVEFINTMLNQRNLSKSKIKAIAETTDVKNKHRLVKSKEELNPNEYGKIWAKEDYKIMKKKLQKEPQIKDIITGIKIGPMSICCQLQNMRKIYYIELVNVILDGNITNIELQIQENDLPDSMIKECIGYIKESAFKGNWNEVVSVILDLQRLIDR